MTKAKSIVRHSKRAKLDILANFLKTSKMKRTAFAEKVGVTPSGVHGWFSHGDIPAWVPLAIRTLEKETRDIPSHLVITIQNGKTDISPIFEADRITINKINYYLIPEKA